ncbi:putative non-specific serine/threonine protein kinase [Helianthus annuus]|uniref:Non-specific serine/threonine protein kinase n=1 Tax=Helianthus annuus TaxID=4232 RepID=A0A251U9Z3_HELAN|nr:putative non-specific serine/threonine protein kinase [Helianthus annuus]KAJ0549188.1 putative non-specific serine/threonine protein kinase [Helianthus annuus]KAJ0562140.1 putative non-specific serine/threonine protein kinase [Helianthus annuus]KAJ0727514.1 putative non-specific serine/threonine protein kinase [Helianthus annuus]KAJ0730311.1 putative non-specific serine/threonine protein kinase [Helianthus annuus]
MASTSLLTTLLLSLLFMLSSSFSCPSHQQQALLHCKSTLTTIFNSGSNLDSWSLTSDCCSWERVTCARTRTSLSSTYLPLSLLWISIRFQWEIPGVGFLNLTKLVNLNMMENRFNGSIPSQIFRLLNLRYLCLSSNLLEGKLEPMLGSLRNLIELDFYNNHFHGPITPQLFKLKSLQYLNLGDNSLEGVLSPEDGML